MDYIQLNSVSKRNRERALLDNVSTTIKKGEITTLEGANGSGKTMFLRAILGLIKTDGNITINGTKLKVRDKYPVKAGILIENPSLIQGFTAFQNMQLLAQLYDNVLEDDIYQLLELFDLVKHAKQKVKKFSLGMKQKLGILQTLIGNPEFIVLDEPTNALDEKSIDTLVEVIRERNENGVTFVIASHDKDFVSRISNQRLVVSEGQVYEKN